MVLAVATAVCWTFILSARWLVWATRKPAGSFPEPP